MFALALSACTLVSCTREGARGGRPNTDRRPNVLVFVTDDQRAAGTLEVMPQTRRLFVEQGVSYPNAFATTPLCCPSRASIFSGRYAHNHGVRVTKDSQALDQATTLQRYLQDAGYRTAVFGKYLNAWPATKEPPYFDEWAIFSESDPNGYRDGSWNLNGRVATVHRYSTDFLATTAERFLREAERSDDGRPWLLFVATAAPHVPFEPAPRDAGAPVPRWKQTPATRELDLGDKPPFLRTPPNLKAARVKRRKQLRTLMAVDDMVGNIYRTLGELDENRRTLGIFMSDNGFSWGENGRVGKTVAHTASVKIPLLLRWPGRLQGGHVDRRVAANIDVAPTAIDAMGTDLDLVEPMDGISLIGRSERTAILIENWQSKFAWASLRTTRRQYVEYYGEDERTVVFRELYDLEKDPWELRNLLRDRGGGDVPVAPVVDRLHSELTRARECVGQGCP